MSSGDRLAELFELAAGESAAGRERILAESGCEPELAVEVRRLLAAHDRATGRPEWKPAALEELRSEAIGGREPGPGDRIGPYRIVSQVGRGGMGLVFRAVRADAEYEIEVAIKCIQAGQGADRVVERFRAERQILAGLEHPNVARLLDGGATADGWPYLVMEFVEGEQPAAFCRKQGLGLREQIGLFRQICAAVHYAHQRMVIHRDLKPGNILVTAAGVPKLLDFGIAKVLKADDPESAAAPTTPLMTPGYASPEQVRGEAATSASDIYSLGVILYELVSGRSPYGEGRPAHELIAAVCQEEPERPSRWRREARGDLDNIILKALSKDPAQRYGSADQFSEDLGRYLEGRPVAARAPSAAYLVARFVARNRLATGAATAAVLLLIAGLVVTVRARDRAEKRFNEVRQLAHAVVFDYHDAIEHLPGSTPVRERLVRDALKYLDGLAAESSDTGLLRELVDAYVRICRVQGDSNFENLGDMAGAIRSSRKATELGERLVAGDGSAGALVSASTAYYSLGSLLHAAGKLNEAEAALRRSEALAQRAVALRADNFEAQSTLAEAWRELGDLLGGAGMQNLGRTEEGLKYYRQITALTEKLEKARPDDIAVLKRRKTALMVTSGTEDTLGLAEEADRDLEAALHLSETVVAREPTNTLEQLELANASLRTGLRNLARQQAGAAVARMERAKSILDQLAKGDPLNALYKRDLSVTESSLAAALRAEGEPETALPHNRRSLELAEELHAGAAGSMEYVADVGISHRKLAETLEALKRTGEGIEHARKSGSMLCAEGSSDAYLQTHCARALAVEGDLELMQRDWAGALTAYGKAAAIETELLKTDSGNAPVRADLARVQAGMGRASLGLRRGAEGERQFAFALSNWEVLRARKALTPEDAARAAETARAVAVFKKSEKN